MPNRDPAIHRAHCRVAAKRYRAAHPDRCARADRNQGYIRRHGVTLQEFESRLALQGNKCAACGADDPGHRFGWQLDHDHHTNAIRAILCGPCNMALGAANDDVARLVSLVEYLEKHK